MQLVHWWRPFVTVSVAEMKNAAAGMWDKGGGPIHAQVWVSTDRWFNLKDFLVSTENVAVAWYNSCGFLKNKKKKPKSALLL